LEATVLVPRIASSLSKQKPGPGAASTQNGRHSRPYW